MDSSADSRTEARVSAPQPAENAAKTEAAPPQARPPKKDKHLYQIDLIRLVTFAGVVLDHVILAITTNAEIVAQGIGLLLRYTRYCFFALTGFVLTYQYRHRELDAPTFWRRRFKLIGLPFLTWSLFYWFFNRWRHGSWGAITAAFSDLAAIAESFKSIAYDLLTGNATYHLYFLSVSMQIYLVFPFVLWLLRRTVGYHRYLLAASLTIHLWLLYHRVRPPLELFADGIPNFVWRNIGITLMPYQFFILAGCLAAFHFEAFTAFMKRWRWPLGIASVVAIVATLVYYDVLVGRGEEVFRATNVFMPHNMFAFLGIIVLLWIGGVAWQNRRTPKSIPDQLMAKASDRSFGIYLAHVTAIFAVTPMFKSSGIGIGWQVFVMYLLVCVLTVFLVEILRLSPFSLITTGRNRIDWRTQNPRKQSAVAAAAIVVGVGIQWLTGQGAGAFLAGCGLILLIGASAVLRKQRTEPYEPLESKASA
ncbi:MAG: acyltransferase [Gordonia sp. (in: high G+C Gram-positive bacteria)]|uniref:acyltransferase n=1 Tax=Gordonia sp. (in: high G+C Gram-positive bacteria) TaxID=84139 RepID=UPI0039E2AA17